MKKHLYLLFILLPLMIFSQQNNINSIINGELFKIKKYPVSYFIENRKDFNLDIYSLELKNNYFKYSDNDTLYLNYLNSFQNFKLYHLTSEKLFKDVNFNYEDEQIENDNSVHIGNIGNKLLLVDCTNKKLILLNFEKFFFYDIIKNHSTLTINNYVSDFIAILDEEFRAIEVIKLDELNNELFLIKLKYSKKIITSNKYHLKNKSRLDFKQIDLLEFYNINKNKKKLLKKDILDKDFKLINIFYYIFYLTNVSGNPIKSF